MSWCSGRQRSRHRFSSSIRNLSGNPAVPLVAFCLVLTLQSCGAQTEQVDASTSMAQRCAESSEFADFSTLPVIRLDFADEVLRSLASGWGQRSEFRLPNRLFALFVGYLVGDGSSASVVEASARKSLESGGWERCPDSRPGSDRHQVHRWLPCGRKSRRWFERLSRRIVRHTGRFAVGVLSDRLPDCEQWWLDRKAASMPGTGEPPENRIEAVSVLASAT